jgi:hypothetical protein
MTPHFLKAAAIFGLGRATKEPSDLADSADFGDFVETNSPSDPFGRLVEGAYDVGGAVLGLNHRYGGI